MRSKPTINHDLLLQPYFPGSVVRNRNVIRCPQGYETIDGATKEQIAMLSRLAVEAFTGIANAGYSFEHCLSTVFISGMALAAEHYPSARKEKPVEEPKSLPWAYMGG